MTKSLQDQLLGAGLIDSKKAKKISKENRKEKKQKARLKDASPDETQVAMQAALRQKQEHDRELNLRLKAEADRKALAAQINQLVEHYKLDRKAGDLEYNFKVDTKIKKIRVTQNMLDEIARGRLCIVQRGEIFDVIPKPIADKIRQRDTSAVVVYNAESSEGASVSTDSETTDSDAAYYAQFEIPDDLVW